MHELLPNAARSSSQRSPLDVSEEGASIYTSYDRGYAEAEERDRSNSLDAADQPRASILTGIGEHSTSSDVLKPLIRSSLLWYGSNPDSEKKWLPIDKLYELINECNVQQELRRAFGGNLSHEELHRYSQNICGHTTYTDPVGNQLRSSRRSLFAILSLLGRTQDISRFLEERISDKDLPLRLNQSTTDNELSSTPCPETRKFKIDWEDTVCDLFPTYQRYMVSPFFKLKSREVPFHDLDHHAVLPFIEDGEDSDSRPRQGHHGTVWRVKIHPAHHDYYEVPPLLFALPLKDSHRLISMIGC